jgi:multidrug efflux pump subunit AcrB
MWLVRVALQRPYTFVVLALIILMVGPLTIARTPKDIFPNIDIPVIAVIWTYTGLSAEEIANRIVSNYERALTVQVADIEHIESHSLRGLSVIKVFFQPTVKIETALGQIAASSQSNIRSMPASTNPPIIVVYSATTVPVLQLALAGEKLSEQQLFDLGSNFLRTQLATVQGASIPNPYGGKQVQIMIDLDPAGLQAKGLSPLDVSNALGAQNLILPAGIVKLGTFEHDVSINGSPDTVEELNDLPIKVVGRSPIFIRDVGHVRNGFPPQTNIVRVNGQRSAMLSIQKSGNASTLDIIARVKKELPRILSGLPPELSVRMLADQSLFVQASIDSVVREGALAAGLTALLILVLLGSWRSTVIIVVSIPLSILASIVMLRALGETINIMTLGGLALAIGILVDNGIVAIENINWNLEQGKDLEPAIYDGAEQITVPAFVSTICICIVFVPMFFLTGVGRFLFVPLAEAVVLAMLASFALSRTLVPTMAKYMLKAHEEDHHAARRASRNPLVRTQAWIDSGFMGLRDAYRRSLEGFIRHNRVFATLFLLGCVASMGLLPFVGQDFFPAVDSGQFKLHMRAATGTRVEETAIICDRVEQMIRGVIPAAEIDTVIDNIGLPTSPLNLIYANSAPIGSADADILVSLKPGHGPTADYIHDLRLKLPRDFPGVLFSFVPADIVTQTLNFGLPAPIDIQIVGRNLEANRLFASSLLGKLMQVPGLVDLRVHQAFDQPQLQLDANRTRAAQVGLTQREVANNLLLSLSGSGQTTPTFWLNPKTGVSYSVNIRMPEYRLSSLQQLGNIPITGAGGARPQLMQGLATVSRSTGMAVVSHYNAQPVIDIFGSVQGRDLGSVSRAIQPILDANQKSLPRGSQMIVRGQIETMNSSFAGLLGGLALAIILVYLLIVVNFQSWLDPFIIISALPSALAGIVWMLFLSGTTISVPALTGSIMCVGVATANSILVVSFAKDQIARGASPAAAAIDAGFSRFRPVLMTALAMIIGMLPTALGLGEGGEQNAPLGRAVVGGLTLATLATLYFVPAVFSVLHRSHASAVPDASAVERV